MKYSISYVLRNIFIPVTILMLSGCYSAKNYHDTEVLGGAQNSGTDPDMELVLSEQEVCLDQELEALGQAGDWSQLSTVESGTDTDTTINYDFPVVYNKQVEAYLNLYQTKQRKHFSRWLARSGKYVPYMQQELAKAGLPTDLAYLAMIESGYNQRACSHAKAVGLWQFMRATGKQYDLRIDNYLDERRDVEKSTAAAIAFLGDLYEEFGDWHLAVAAYNAGPGKVRSGMRRYKVDNFWDLAEKRHLKLETKRYVPKLIAAIVISKDPERYGFTDIEWQEALTYDTFKAGPSMSLDAIATVSESSLKTIKDLNPHLIRSKTPPDSQGYEVIIPAGKLAIADSNKERLHSYVSTGFKTHKIKSSDSIRGICKKYNINTTTLLKVNNLRSSKLVAGTNLRIPYSTIKYQLLPEGSEGQLAAYKENLILHQIKKGESISKIAKKYGVPADMIVSWNGLKSIHKIRAGQQLALFINYEGGAVAHGGSSPQFIANDSFKIKASQMAASTPVKKRSRSVVPILADTKKQKIKASGQTSEYSWYQVKSGDSLWTISRKFKISAANLKKWNNLSSNTIQPGEKLKIKNV